MAVRDLRGKSAEAWEKLEREREIVITSNGKPIAIMTAVSEGNLEEALTVMRRLQAIMAAEALQKRSAEKGLDKLSAREINEEIRAVRRLRQMKIVLDTNVLVAGLLSPYGASAGIVGMVSSGILRLCYDARIMVEYQDVLARPKFQFDFKEGQGPAGVHGTVGEIVATSPLNARLPDVHDEIFLEVALAGRAVF